MRYIDARTVARLLPYAELIDALHDSFKAAPSFVPPRQVLAEGKSGDDNFLVVMPAWDKGRSIGIKVATLFPANAASGLPSVMASYLLLDGRTGEPRACLDATELTCRRTAATSALAMRLLARSDAARLCIIGTGGLAPYMIEGHAAVRQLRQVDVWGRSFDKAAALCRRLEVEGRVRMPIAPVRDLKSTVESADIVVTATTAAEPVLQGEWLRPGAHVDLVGAFTPATREADDQVMRRARIFVDERDAAFREAGDVIIPVERGVIDRQAVLGDLRDLVVRPQIGRSAATDITVFKSVGLAIEDLVAARLVTDRYSSAGAA